MFAVKDLNSRGYGFFVFSIFTPIAASLAVSVRVWIRMVMLRMFGIEDYLLVFSLVNYVLASILGVVLALQGFGQHQADLTSSQLVGLFKVMYAECIFAYLSIISLRISFCLLFLRITQVPWQRRILYAITIISTSANLVNLLRNNIFYCVPVADYWRLFATTDPGSCISNAKMNQLLQFQYATSAVADWGTSVLPIFILRAWTSNNRAKMVTYALLGLGIFASAASITALVLTPTASSTGDYTYTAYKIFIAQWSEPFIGLLAASFSTYRPLFKWLNDTTRTRFTTRSRSHSPQVSESSQECPKLELTISLNASMDGASRRKSIYGHHPVGSVGSSTLCDAV